MPIVLVLPVLIGIITPVKNVEHSWLLWLSKTMVSVPEGSGFVKNWIEEGKICVLVFVPYKSVQI